MSFQTTLSQTLTLSNKNQWAEKEIFAAPVPIIVILGKSNVGKSTILNSMVRGKAARFGKNPGLTSFIQVYEVKRKLEIFFYLIDFPGYGYAMGGKKREKNLQDLIIAFLKEKKHKLTCALFLLDIRRALDRDKKESSASYEESDSFFSDRSKDIFWLMTLSEFEIPILILANKVDKTNQSERTKALKNIAQKLSMDEKDIFPVSGLKNKGIQDVMIFLKENFFKTPPILS
jgi:GTP-binding protein